MRSLSAFVLVVMAASAACDGKKKDGADAGPWEPEETLDASDFTYTLEQSTDQLLLWTTPCTHKVRTVEGPPPERKSGLGLAAARREFEPVQVVIGPAAGTVTAEIAPFPQLGGGQRVELAVAGFEDGWSESLTPIASGGTVALSESHGVPLWITVYVPAGAPAGEHQTTLTLTPEGGASIDVPVRLRVFDFALPAEHHFKTQLNIDVASLIPNGGDQEDVKDLLFEHRMTPKSVTWPSGFNWSITWENPASSDPCEILWDEPDEPDQYSIGWLAPRYILGQGWNDVGFPSAMLFQFVDNSTPRPAEFCGIARGDHYGTAEYNAEWSEFIAALEQYLADHAMIDKGYYYVQNEPQNEEDHALAAHLCRLMKQAAPSLRIAISEEPKPEIAEDPGGECGYDIWIAHVRAYERDYAWQRQLEHGEEVWLYSLDQDPDPFYNPTRIDNQGIHQRIIPWSAWTLRVAGWAYYDAGRYFDGPRPGVRAELLREGFEDYEYLYLANDRDGGGAFPQVGATETADPTAASVASSLTGWTRDVDALMALRFELGRYIEGSTDELPLLESTSDVHPRDEYYLNFQDPDGQPAADPLEVDGKTYLKIGWQPYDDEDGYGWYGEHVGDPSIALYGYDAVDGYSEVQRSYLYDDWGRDALFEFALENGTYDVTVGAGRPASGYPNDPHNVAVEGQVVIDDEPTSDTEPVIERTVTVELMDGMLSLEMGGMSQLTGDWAYTFMAHLEIVPVD